MPKQVTLDSLVLNGLNIFRETERLRVEANYSIMAGTEIYKTETRDLSLSIPSETILDLENAWDTILALIKTSESI